MMQLTILVPSHKEGGLVRDTYEVIKRELDLAGIVDYEIILSNCFHEGDDTAMYAKEVAERDSHVVYRQRSTCWNLGKHYRAGIQEARGEYFMFVPGDNETIDRALANIFGQIGKVDVVITYTENPWVRPPARRATSYVFQNTCNVLFGLRLKYFNGINLYRTKLLRRVPLKTESFAYSAEILVRLLSSHEGVTYVEVAMPIHPPERRSAAFRLKNVWGVISAITKLFWDIRIKKQELLPE